MKTALSALAVGDEMTRMMPQVRPSLYLKRLDREGANYLYIRFFGAL